MLTSINISRIAFFETINKLVGKLSTFNYITFVSFTYKPLLNISLEPLLIILNISSIYTFIFREEIGQINYETHSHYFNITI